MLDPEVKQENLQKVRKFENSQLVFDLYAHLSKCRHVLKEKCKAYSIDGKINIDNLVNVLENLVPLDNFNRVKWRIVANLGDKKKDGNVEIDYFLNAIKKIGEKATRHPGI